jgi:general secretion pathway protein A
MGKTSLCRALIQDLDRQTVTSLVGDPVLSVDDLLRMLIADFGVMAQEDLAHMQRPLLTRTLNAFLESLSLRDRSAVVFIDEAQNVPTGLLVDLAALLDQGAGGRVLQLVLVGQPALTTLLGHGDLRGIDERIARRLELGPLAAGEIAPYVRHRLTVAGGGSRIAFDAGAIERLFARSAGVPRVVNLLCDRAMTRGHQTSAAVITAPLIEAAATDLDLDAVVERPGILNTLLLWALLALLVLGGAAGALWVWRDAVNQAILRWENVPLPPVAPIPRLPVPLAPIPPSEPGANVSPSPPI